MTDYYFLTDSPNDVLAVTEYGLPFASAINYKMIYGVQFHPEKSHQWGVNILKNFADL